MRIKLIADCINDLKTGMGNYVFNLADSLKERGANLTLINYKQSEQFNTELYPNILKDRFLHTYSWYLFLPFLIKKEAETVIHNPSQVPTFFSFNGKNITTVADLTTLKLPGHHKSGRELITRMLLPRTLKKSNKIIVVSENTQKDLLNFFPFISEKKVRVVYPAANKEFKIIQDSSLLDEVKRKYNLPEKFILYVGTLEPRKNIVRLLHAFSGVHKKTRVPLVIAGKKGWKYKEIFMTLKNLNLSEKVLFTGYVKERDLPVLYNLATVFVYPSLYEGFGLPPLEAMRCGCPVITSNISSLPEVVGDAAIKVSPHSSDEIEAAMLAFLSSKSLRDEYIDRGIKQAEKFSWERCAEETLQVYREALGEN